MSKKINIENYHLSIGQVAKELELPVHTIRFWSEQFPHIQSNIGKGNRRYFSEKEVTEFAKIKTLIEDKLIPISAIKKMIKYNSINEKEGLFSNIIESTEKQKETNVEINVEINEENQNTLFSQNKINTNNNDIKIKIQECIDDVQSLLKYIKEFGEKEFEEKL